jgi:hypothetical protein
MRMDQPLGPHGFKVTGADAGKSTHPAKRALQCREIRTASVPGFEYVRIGFLSHLAAKVE